jgi:membrane complex biogenesis BtpA family protein
MNGWAQGLQAVWPEGKPLIGMVHLLPLPGSPRWGGSMERVLERALTDARHLHEGGMQGILVENFLDAPFYGSVAPPETVAAMSRIVASVCGAVDVPVGVNVLRNDARAALGVAAATGAAFIRVNVHTGIMWTDQGAIQGSAADTLRARVVLAPDVAILADVLVKHATPPPGLTLEDAAADSWGRGLADGLVVSGSGTGKATELQHVHRVREAVPAAPVLVGSGVRIDAVGEVLAVADGAVVGTALTREDRAGSGVDPERVRRLVEAGGTAQEP